MACRKEIERKKSAELRFPSSRIQESNTHTSNKAYEMKKSNTAKFTSFGVAPMSSASPYSLALPEGDVPKGRGVREKRRVSTTARRFS